MKKTTKIFLIIFMIFFSIGLLNIDEARATRPGIQMYTGVKIKLKNNDVLEGYVIWSPYDAPGWDQEIWNGYIKSADEFLFTQKIYVIKCGKFEDRYYTVEESKKIKAWDVSIIKHIKLKHDGYVSDVGIRSIPLDMAKYSETHKPVAMVYKADDAVSFGWEGCIISFNKKYSEAVLEKKFYKLIKLPPKSLIKNKLILAEYVND